MSGSAKGSKWYVTPNERRTRKRFELTLSEEALERLLELASEIKPQAPERARSEVVERFIMSGRPVPPKRKA